MSLSFYVNKRRDGEGNIFRLVSISQKRREGIALFLTGRACVPFTKGEETSLCVFDAKRRFLFLSKKRKVSLFSLFSNKGGSVSFFV